MTDRDALLAAILSDPADDLPRLMYADWLDENGESERAEFVRFGTGYSREDRITYRKEIKKSIKKLMRGAVSLRRHSWINDILDRGFGFSVNGWDYCVAPLIGHALFSRGFVASVRLSWADWLKHHEALYWHPKQTVECPAYYNPNDFTERICNCGGAGRIPRSFVATAQPITEVELTTWMPRVENIVRRDRGEADSFFTLLDNDERLTFTRVKCPACDGSGGIDSGGFTPWGSPIDIPCPDCDGQPLNEWTCDKWPTITFKTP